MSRQNEVRRIALETQQPGETWSRALRRVRNSLAKPRVDQLESQSHLRRDPAASGVAHEKVVESP